MTAEVKRRPPPWKYQAWCDACKDGLNANQEIAAIEWTRDHNGRKHPQVNKNGRLFGPF